MEAPSTNSAKESHRSSLADHVRHGSIPKTTAVDLINTEHDLQQYWDSLDAGRCMRWHLHILQDDNGKTRVISLQDVSNDAQDSQEPIIMINIEALAEKAFTTVGSKNKSFSLKMILESNKCPKYSFPWRTFAACLYREYGVSLRANVSIQLLHNAMAISRRQENTVDVPVLKDLEHCITDYVDGVVDPTYLFVGSMAVELYFLRDGMKNPMPSCSEEIDSRTAAFCCASVNLMSKLNYLINASPPLDKDSARNQIHLQVLRASTEDVVSIPPAENSDGTFTTSPFTLDLLIRNTEESSDEGNEASEAGGKITDVQDGAESKAESSNAESNMPESTIPAGKKKRRRRKKRRSKRQVMQAYTAQTCHTSGNYQISSYQNGAYQNGTYQNGTYPYGSYQNGAHQNGTYQNGTYPYYGNYQNGAYPYGNYQNGAYQNGIRHSYCSGHGWHHPTASLPPPAYYSHRG